MATATDQPISRPDASEPEINLTQSKSGTSALSPEAQASMMKHLGVEAAPAPPEPPAQAPAKPAATTVVPPTKPEVAATTPALPAGATTEETATKSANEPKADEKPPNNQQLRDALKRAQAKVSELETSFGATTKEKADAYAKLAEIELKTKTWEERYTKEFEPAIKQLTEREKKVQELEEALIRQDFTKSTQWHDTHVKPIVEEQQEVANLLREVSVTGPDGRPQAATQAHFNEVLAAPSLNEAERIAKGYFGEGFATTELVRHSARIRTLVRNRNAAFETMSTQALKWKEQEKVQQVQNLENLKRAVQTKEQAYLNEVQIPEGDEELHRAMQEGRTLADRLVNGSPDMTSESWADTLAKGRSHIMERQVLRTVNSRLKAQIAAQEKELAQYRASEPAVETRNDPAPAARATTQQQLPGQEDYRAPLLEAAKRAISNSSY